MKLLFSPNLCAFCVFKIFCTEKRKNLTSEEKKGTAKIKLYIMNKIHLLFGNKHNIIDLLSGYKHICARLLFGIELF